MVYFLGPEKWFRNVLSGIGYVLPARFVACSGLACYDGLGVGIFPLFHHGDGEVRDCISDVDVGVRRAKYEKVPVLPH